MKRSRRGALSSLFALSVLFIHLAEVRAQELPLHYTFHDETAVDSSDALVIEIGNESRPGTPESRTTTWLTIRRSLAIEVISRFKSGDMGQTSADLKFTLDLNPIRDALISSRIFERDTRNFGTYAVDLGLMAATEAVAGIIEYLILKESGQDTTWNGAQRLYDEVGRRGLGAFRWEGVGWRDGNFGTWQNTIHGVPFYLASTFFRARGYSPVLSALGGIITGLVIHESLAEAWEQPKSGHDILMNSLSAIAGAIPGMGQEVQISALTGQPTSRFYVEDKSLGRVFFAFEQVRSFTGIPVDQIPVRPWNFLLGFEAYAADWISIGPQLNLLTDESELHSFWKTFQLNHAWLGIGVKIKVP